ncbi:Zn ribbon nucleic-acid-binding protein [Rhizobium binae]|uniref:Zn ribbon nucleic-acid-binding protein n=1 Tax=Rhizobium binae TaxID=1138190 RepID=A0ABV2MEM7_9HYPH|nr:hypothetical protein [Rhizobium binae]
MPRFQPIEDWSPGYMNATPSHLDIMAECVACGQTRPFSKESLPQARRHAEVSDVEKRLKCVACGAKAGKLRWLLSGGRLMIDDTTCRAAAVWNEMDHPQ